MNYNERDRYGRDRDSYQTHRSERYRHPDQDMSSSRSSDYRSSDRDRDRTSYSNEFYRSSQRRSPQDWDPQHVANRGLTTYDTARNYGNMGSYGGAQGFGSERGGFSHHRSSDMGSEFESGMGESRYSDRGRGQSASQGRRYGYQSDYDSHGQNSDNYRYEDSSRSQHDNYTSRRRQDPDHSRPGYERGDYNTRSFGGDRGKYMGSGYERTPRSNEYGATRGDYGSAGQYMGTRFGGSSYDEPYGMSGYYRGGYGDTDYNSYARDRDERNYDR
ncbi:hypothetical protein H8S95_02860 [Pontibacter sp. KCTC 32443]|uniref:hypothetical protein n=1 Tax=Pontibacter TaxID=323449 RepID=UPI00164D2AD0|nr:MULTISPECIES: hypothetical protein [Pontibacter]MBC5772991.1 hypothetical protein [Pontibacter sp. KCTC 32443]